jgi:hypothetical protein
LQLIKNFNLRYECNDARDDYSAKLKKDEDKNGFFPSWASADILKDLDQNVFEYDDDTSIDVEAAENIYLEPTSAYLKKLEDMNAIENIICNAGWLVKCPDVIEHINSQGFAPNIQMSSSKWSSVIKSAKDAVLALQGKHILVNNDGTPLKACNFNNVVVQDISYLQKDFKAETAEKQQLINNTVCAFVLNSEQERAFRIIANHATIA